MCCDLKDGVGGWGEVGGGKDYILEGEKKKEKRMVRNPDLDN